MGGKNLNKTTQKTAEYIVENVKDVQVGETGGDWVIFALKASGTDVASQDYYDAYYDNIRGLLKSGRGVLSKNSLTTYERVSMALTAIGKDPKKVEGYDITKRIDDYAGVSGQGYNAEMFALISSDYCGFRLKNEKRYLRDILGCQLKNGAMTLDNETADVDMTAMGIQALAPYEKQKECGKAIGKALSYLSQKQNSDGSYDSAESTAQVIIAIAALSRDPLKDGDFTKKGGDLGDGLMKYSSGSAFEHKKGEGVNLMATTQALCALDAITLAKEGKKIYER